MDSLMTYRQKLDFLDQRLPLEVPLFAAKSGQRLQKTVILEKFAAYAVYYWGYYVYKTVCGLEFYITDPKDGLDTEFTQHLDRSDPNDFKIPLDIVYQIAQNPANGTIVWLLCKEAISGFWESPLCEPRLMGIMAGYLKIQ